MAIIQSHLRPFRDYNEKDVINFFTFSGIGLPIPNGLVVSITGAGFVPGVANPIEFIGDYAQGPGQPAFLNNVQAQRYGVLPKITLCQSGFSGGVSTGLTPIGITLFDMAEFDENGEPLKYNPRKAAEMEVVISGQAIPIVTKGIFQISGIDPNSNPVIAGQAAYNGANGLITNISSGNTKIGYFLGGQATSILTSGQTDGSYFVRLSF